MQANSDKYKSFTLNHFFDTRRQNLIPRLKMAALGGKFSRVLAIHDEVTNNLVLAEPDTGIVIPITMPNNIIDTVKDMKDKLTGKVNKDVKSLRMLNDFATDNQLLFWSPGGHTIQLMNLEEGSIVKVNFPFVLKSVHPLNKDQYLVVKDSEATIARQKQHGLLSDTSSDTDELYLLKRNEETDPIPTVLNPIKHVGEFQSIVSLDKKGLSDFGLKMALGEKTQVPNTLFTTQESYANIAMGFPELEFSASEIHHWPRKDLPTLGAASAKNQSTSMKNRFNDPSRDLVFLNDSCQIVRPVATPNVPRDGVAGHVAVGNCVAFLEVVDLMAGQVQ